MAAKHYLTPRAIGQIVLTILNLVTAGTAFFFALTFQHSTELLNQNFVGTPVNDNSPCIRNTLPECSNLMKDTCYQWCCPDNYHCERSPVVGLFCQHAGFKCAKDQWCMRYADISGQCRTEECQEDALVYRMANVAFVASGIGVMVDIVDIVVFAACPDAVIFKSIINICSSCVKWIAFGVMVGSGATEFMQKLLEARCYNGAGMDMNKQADSYLFAYIILQVASAALSLVLAPVSAYYGGKLIGVPYVK